MFKMFKLVLRRKNKKERKGVRKRENPLGGHPSVKIVSVLMGLECPNYRVLEGVARRCSTHDEDA